MGAVLLDWGTTRANAGGQSMCSLLKPCAERRVARELLQAVILQCESLGVREFNLAATQDARGLYSSLGFEDYPAEMRRR